MKTINLQPISTERFGNLNFVVAEDQEGQFYAYREISPLFCFSGESIQDVLNKVSRAFELYNAA